VKTASLLALLVLTAAGQTQYATNPNRSLSAPFDTPLQTSVVDLGPSPHYLGSSRPHVRLSCFFFPHFFVKEYDEGQKGAAWLSIVPISTQDVRQCTPSHASGERLIDNDEWCGYFNGVKDNFAIFNACDDAQGGLPFAVYDTKTGKKIFEDSAYDSRVWPQKDKPTGFDQLQVIVSSDKILLKYLRVVLTECDLRTETTSCWKQVRTKIDLKSAQLPLCTHYEGVTTRWVSMFAYPVEVTLSTPTVTRTSSGPLKCWPVY
jgi:hypothetical protein